MANAGAAGGNESTALAGFMPRISSGICAVPGPAALPPGSRLPETHKFLRRAMLLTGTTPVMMTIHDLGVAVDYLLEQDEMKERELYLYGKGDSGVAALYRGLLDERIAGVILEDVISSHIDGSPILGILRSMDIPQAVGLMAPRKVALVNAGHINWTWAARAYERLGCIENFISSCDLREAMDKLRKT